MWGVLSDEKTGLLFTNLLVLARAIILGSDSHGAYDYILLSQIRDSPNLESQIPLFNIPGTGWPVILEGTGFPFLSPPTTRSLSYVSFLLNNTYEFSSYLTGNTLCFRYKDQQVNAV
jgi:hypothetical protein